MTRQETVALLAVIKAAYPGRFEVNDEVVALWSEMLDDLDGRLVAATLKMHIRESKFPPTIADLAQPIAEAASDVPDWQDAWREALEAVSRYGRYRAPRFSHDAVTMAVDAIGWQALCNTLEEDLPTLRAQFRDMYLGYRRRAVREANVGRFLRERSAQLLGSGTTDDSKGRHQ